jgi:hypothetical protein
MQSHCRVGDSLAANLIAFISSAFGTYVYDTRWLSKWQLVGDAVVLDKAAAQLRAVKMGESVLQVSSACKLKHIKAAQTVVEIKITVVD